MSTSVLPTFTWAMLPMVFNELRKLAAHLLARERAYSRDVSELVNTALENLFRSCQGDWKNKTYFFGAARLAMKRQLVDWARDRAREVRGEPTVTSIEEIPDAEVDPRIEALWDAMVELQKNHPEWVKAIGEIYWRGETATEIARQEGVTEKAIRKHVMKGEDMLGQLIVEMEQSRSSVVSTSSDGER